MLHDIVVTSLKAEGINKATVNGVRSHGFSICDGYMHEVLSNWICSIVAVNLQML